MRRRFVTALHGLMASDARLVLLLADVGEFAFKDVFRDYPTRAYNLGISEQAIVDMAVGLSRAGFVPVVYGIAPFLVERAYEQVKLACANGAQFVLVSVGASFDYGREGPTHHCPADVPILFQVPGMNILVPGTPAEMASLLGQALERQALPCYLRLSEAQNPCTYPVRLGAPLLIDGDEATVVAVGPVLAQIGAPEGVMYVTSVRPLCPCDFEGYSIHEIVEPYFPLLGGVLSGVLSGPVRSTGVKRGEK